MAGNLVQRIGMGLAGIGIGVLAGCNGERMSYEEYVARSRGYQPRVVYVRDQAGDAFRICNVYASTEARDPSAIRGEKTTFFPDERITFVAFWPGRGTGRLVLRSESTGNNMPCVMSEIDAGMTRVESLPASEIKRILGGRIFKAEWYINGSLVGYKPFIIRD